MIPIISWFIYLAYSFLLLPIIHLLRFRKWPIIFHLWPKNLYDFNENVLTLIYLIFTISLILKTESPVWVWQGIICMILGASLMTWAIFTLGKNWRIGQDAKENDLVFVLAGPYRFTNHPIYLALILISLGQLLIMGIDWLSVMLVLAHVLYAMIQAPLETKLWKKRNL